MRIPEDVRLLTLANRGNGPCYYKPISRIELDPLALGEVIADRVLRILAGRKVERETVFQARFISGETF